MSYVIKKMRNQVAYTLLGVCVFLTAYIAVPAFYLSITIKAVLFLPFFKMRHRQYSFC